MIEDAEYEAFERAAILAGQDHRLPQRHSREQQPLTADAVMSQGRRVPRRRIPMPMTIAELDRPKGQKPRG
jgi:hypothetical protein